MVKPVLSFDIDGVIAESPYTQPSNRTAKDYLGRKLFSEDVPFRLNKIIAQTDVWLLSTRQIENAHVQLITFKWLLEKGINILGLRGVVCNLTILQKAEIATSLKSVVHFDDDPRVLDFLFEDNKGYLVDNPEYLLNQNASYQRVYTWQDISKICSDIINTI